MPEAAVKPREKEKPKRIGTATYEMCEGLVTFGNTLVQIPFKADGLDEQEVKALSKSLYKSAKTNVWLGNLIIRATSAARESELFATGGAIVGRRLVRHNVLPEEVGPSVEFLAALIIANAAGEELEVSEGGLGAGGALPDFGVNGHGQNGAAREAVPDAEVRDPLSRQAGYASLAEFQADQDSSGNGFGQTEPGWVDPLAAASRRRKPRGRVSEGD